MSRYDWKRLARLQAAAARLGLQVPDQSRPGGCGRDVGVGRRVGRQPGFAGADLPGEAAMKLIMGTMLGLAFALVAAAAITPNLKEGPRWFLLLLGSFLFLAACVLICVLAAVGAAEGGAWRLDRLR